MGKPDQHPVVGTAKTPSAHSSLYTFVVVASATALVTSEAWLARLGAALGAPDLANLSARDFALQVARLLEIVQDDLTVG